MTCSTLTKSSAVVDMDNVLSGELRSITTSVWFGTHYYSLTPTYSND
jgi:hypothetical protein